MLVTSPEQAEGLGKVEALPAAVRKVEMILYLRLARVAASPTTGRNLWT